MEEGGGDRTDRSDATWKELSLALVKYKRLGTRMEERYHAGDMGWSMQCGWQLAWSCWRRPCVGKNRWSREPSAAAVLCMGNEVCSWSTWGVPGRLAVGEEEG